MNRFRTLLVMAPLALLSVGAPLGFWAFRHRSFRERSADLPLARAQVVSAAEQREDDSSALEKIYTKDDRLSYEGYIMEKSQVKGEDSWMATLKKGNHVVAKFENGWNKEWTSFGLFSFTGGEPKQLVVEQYSGGAHCCYSYWIYELSPSLRLLFNNEKYGTGNQLFPLDLDGDGVSELKQSVMAFDYFHMSHASSVFPQGIFAYEKSAGEYRPANRRFSAYALRGVEGDIKELETLKAQGNPDNDDIYSERYFSAVLQVTLKYIYAGKRDEGWAFFNREYKTHEGISREKMRAEINDTLQGEPVYSYIYSNGAE
jgi:hypothetical protein